MKRDDAGDPPARAAAVPFSRPFPVDRLRHRDEVVVDVEADAKERAALAAVNGLVSVDRLTANFRLSPLGAGVRVVGGVTASVVQTCIVTLEPLEAEVREAVDVRFAPEAEVAAAEAAAAKAFEESFLDAAEIEEPPDPILDGRIDLGAVAAEFLALGLDPYPRKPGAELDLDVKESDAPPVVESPFAALQRLKDTKG